MSKTRCVAVLAILLGLVGRSVMAANATLPQIWFSTGGMGKPAPAPNWQTAVLSERCVLARVHESRPGRRLSDQVLQRISDEDLAKVVARLKEKHVGFGVEMLAQAYTLPGINPPHCGEGVEGYFAPNETAALAAKLKRAGATVQYVAMDEPLVWPLLQ